MYKLRKRKGREQVVKHIENVEDGGWGSWWQSQGMIIQEEEKGSMETRERRKYYQYMKEAQNNEGTAGQGELAMSGVRENCGGAMVKLA